MNYTANPDGSLTFDEPFACLSTYYAISPDNPHVAIPKVPVCPVRRIELRTLQCGRKRADWHCDLLEEKVTPKKCWGCKVCPST